MTGMSTQVLDLLCLSVLSIMSCFVLNPNHLVMALSVSFARCLEQIIQSAAAADILKGTAETYPSQTAGNQKSETAKWRRASQLCHQDINS